MIATAIVHVSLNVVLTTAASSYVSLHYDYSHVHVRVRGYIFSICNLKCVCTRQNILMHPYVHSCSLSLKCVKRLASTCCEEPV